MEFTLDRIRAVRKSHWTEFGKSVVSRILILVLENATCNKTGLRAEWTGDWVKWVVPRDMCSSSFLNGLWGRYGAYQFGKSSYLVHSLFSLAGERASLNQTASMPEQVLRDSLESYGGALLVEGPSKRPQTNLFKCP